MASTVNAGLIVAYPHVESILNKPIELSDGAIFNGHETNHDLSFDDAVSYDLWETPFIRYVAAREHGLKVTAIPVFLARRFVQWMIQVAETSDFHEAKQLEGKRVAQHYNGNTDAIWVKGVLEESYGVDLSSVSWFTLHGERVAEAEAPTGVVLLDGADPNELLLSGAVDAVLVNGYGHAPAAGVRRLWADPEREAAAWYESSKFFPILHLLVVRDEALAAHDSLARDLCGLFEGAKLDALERWDYGATLPDEKRALALRSGFPGSAWGGAARSFLPRDPLPYGLEANRDELERVVRYAFQQGAIQELYPVEELFAPTDA